LTAVAVGFIALAGVVMLIYLNQALAERQARCANGNRTFTRRDLYDAIMEGAVERIRPKMMTVVTIMAGPQPTLLQAESTRATLVPMLPSRSREVSTVK
jgi:Cu(I)/Ag(I) efflux system membrane protein CusA/SilA